MIRPPLTDSALAPTHYASKKVPELITRRFVSNQTPSSCQLPQAIRFRAPALEAPGPSTRHLLPRLVATSCSASASLGLARTKAAVKQNVAFSLRKAGLWRTNDVMLTRFNFAFASRQALRASTVLPRAQM